MALGRHRRHLPLPVAGTGVILLMAAFILVSGGVLGELVYKLGDVRERDFSRLTVKVWRQSAGAHAPRCLRMIDRKSDVESLGHRAGGQPARRRRRAVRRVQGRPRRAGPALRD